MTSTCVYKIIDNFQPNMELSITHNEFVNINNTKFGLDNEIIKKLLDKYNALKLSSYTRLFLNSIPKNIIKLALQFNTFDDISLDNLQSNITELYILHPTGWKGYFNSTINNLPSNLQFLHINSEIFNQSLDYLPQCIKKLSIFSNVFNKSLSNLPTSLEYLYIDNWINRPDLEKIKYEYDLYNLPKNLIELQINKCYLVNTNIKVLKQMYPQMKINIK